MKTAATGTAPGRRIGARVSLVAVALIALALVLHAPTLGRGFNYDDFIHQYLLRYAMQWPDAGPWRLYDFSFWTATSAAQQAGGLAPWWVSPDFKTSFFRPVTSLSLLLDYRLYGGWAPGYHVTSLALFGVLLLLAFLLYCELGAPSRAALWALAFFALSGNHVLPVGWIANRNELLSSLFVVAMMLNVSRYGRLGGMHRLVSGVACFLLACLSKESGLIGLPLVGLYLWILKSPVSGESRRGRFLRVARSRTLWTFVVCAGAYMAVYLAFGHGATSANYATPWRRTGVYLGRLAALFPLASGSLFFGLSTDLVFTRPQLYGPVLGLAAALFALLLGVLWLWLRRTPLAWFAAGWVAAALFPMAGVTLSDRLLMSASLGSALLLGLLVDRTGSVREILGGLRSRWPALLFVALNLVVAVLAGWVRSHMFFGMAAADRAASANAEIVRADAAAGPVIALNSPSTLLALTMRPTWAVTHDDPKTAIYFLAMARLGETCVRESDDTLVVTCDAPFLLAHRYERVFRASEAPPPPGTVFVTPAFTATVLATEGLGIKSVRFTFRKGLEAYRFLAWQRGVYRRVSPPPVGRILRLPAPEPTVPWVP